MRLRFLGAPHVSKSSPVAVDFPAVCKEEVIENAQVEKTLLPAPSSDVASPRQLRQRRAGVGLWAIRRQKLERAQLRPRIVVHMSRLRGRRTMADIDSENLHMKHKSRHLPVTKNAPSGNSTSLDIMETRNGTASTVRDTGINATSGIKHIKLEEDEVRDVADSRQLRDNECEQKPASDVVNSRPKRHIMQKKMVSYRFVYKYSGFMTNQLANEDVVMIANQTCFLLQWKNIVQCV